MMASSKVSTSNSKHQRSKGKKRKYERTKTRVNVVLVQEQKQDQELKDKEDSIIFTDDEDFDYTELVAQENLWPVEKFYSKVLKPRDEDGEEDFHFETKFVNGEARTEDMTFGNDVDQEKIPIVTQMEFDAKELVKVYNKQKTGYRTIYCPYCYPQRKTFSLPNTLRTHVRKYHPVDFKKPIWDDRRYGPRKENKKGGRPRGSKNKPKNIHQSAKMTKPVTVDDSSSSSSSSTQTAIDADDSMSDECNGKTLRETIKSTKNCEQEKVLMPTGAGVVDAIQIETENHDEEVDLSCVVSNGANSRLLIGKNPGCNVKTKVPSKVPNNQIDNNSGLEVDKNDEGKTSNLKDVLFFKKVILNNQIEDTHTSENEEIIGKKQEQETLKMKEENLKKKFNDNYVDTHKVLEVTLNKAESTSHNSINNVDEHMSHLESVTRNNLTLIDRSAGGFQNMQVDRQNDLDDRDKEPHEHTMDRGRSVDDDADALSNENNPYNSDSIFSDW